MLLVSASMCSFLAVSGSVGALVIGALVVCGGVGWGMPGPDSPGSGAGEPDISVDFAVTTGALGPLAGSPWVVTGKACLM